MLEAFRDNHHEEEMEHLSALLINSGIIYYITDGDTYICYDGEKSYTTENEDAIPLQYSSSFVNIIGDWDVYVEDEEITEKVMNLWFIDK